VLAARLLVMPMADRSDILEFAEAELFGAFRRVMSEPDASWMARSCSEPDLDDCADYTPDTLILLSLQSPELEARVRSYLAGVWAGPGGDARRGDWDMHRAALAATLESGEPWSVGDSGK
jgi:hypothetical protein